jgi:hypothetical protein
MSVQEKLEAKHNSSRALSDQRTARLSDFSGRVTCRLAQTYAERDAIFKHRYKCYLRAGLISSNSFERHMEAADSEKNSYLIGLYIDRKLISSLRIQVVDAVHPNSVSVDIFPEILKPLIKGDKTVVDMSCVATDGELAQPYRLMPYVILRSWIVAAEHFHADYIAAAVQPQHQVFYLRVLKCEPFSERRSLPRHSASVRLIGLNFLTSAERLYKDLPFLRSTASERQHLFEKQANPSEATSYRPSAP